jgi:hypothetical protein
MEIWLVDSTGMTGILKESVGQGKDLVFIHEILEMNAQ